MRTIVLRLGAIAFLIAAMVLPASAQSTNIALGRPYTLSPRPNYSLTTDTGDDTDLTDGVHTSNNPIWTRVSTVGWSNVSPVTIVIDLQSVQPIAGVSYSTAAGSAGVQWPRSIFVLTSDDGRTYFPAADLAALPAEQPAPPTSGYAAFQFGTGNLHTHGRYVAILVDGAGPFTFCDEITVTRGESSWLTLPFDQGPTSDLQQYFVTAHILVSIERRLLADIAAARASLAASQADDDVRRRLTSALDEAAAAAGATPTPDPNTFRTVLPLNDLHTRILAVQGAVAAADGLPPVSAWAANPWDYLGPTDRPPPGGSSGVVQVMAMIGETRAGAINFANSTDAATAVSIGLTDASGNSWDGDARLYSVEWTDTRDLTPVADALVPLPADRTLDLSAGMVRQLWISFTPRDRPAGSYSGYVEARAGAGLVARVPFQLTVLAGTLPDRPTLHLGGWDYTDNPSAVGGTSSTASALIPQLRALNVDSPWATSRVMPAGSYDAQGRLAQRPDTSAFDRWINDWPDARQYFVFVNAGSALGSVPATSALFATAVGQWVSFWADHAAHLGIQPAQLVLLLADEPATTAIDDRIVVWATAIKAAQPEIQIWEDPQFANPAAAPPRFLSVTDTIALGRALVARQGAPLISFYQGWATGDRTLNVYGSLGPARLLDPYTYERLQAWLCADVGATGSFFWSFADDAGGASWNEYRTAKTVFSPFFLSSDQVVISKHSEAIREGMEDFEYLAIARTAKPDVFAAAIRGVLAPPSAADLQWTSAKDRSAAEQMRRSIADALGLIVTNPPPTPTPRAPLVPTITIAGNPVQYDGTPHAVTAIATGTDGSPLAGSIRIAYSPGDSSPPVSAGTYIVTATFVTADPTYGDAAAAASFTIRPAVPTMTAASNAVDYDGLAHTVTALAAGVDGLPVSGSLRVAFDAGDGTAPINAGTYVVTALFRSADPNYTDATTTGSLTIRPIAPTLVLAATPAAYDASPHGATVIAAGLNGSPIAGTAAVAYTPGGAALPVNVGAYAVAATFRSGDLNYSDASISGTITVLPAAPAITIRASAKRLEGGVFITATALVSGIGAVPVAGPVRISYVPQFDGVDGSTYVVNVNFTSADPNYADATGVQLVDVETSSGPGRF